VEAREGVEGGDAGGERDDVAVGVDRPADVAEAGLGEAGDLRPDAGGAARVGDLLEALGVAAEEFGELAEGAFALEHPREGVERGVVGGLLVEVLDQDLDAAAALLEDADDPRDVEAEVEATGRVLGALQLVATEDQQLGVALVSLIEVGEATDGLQVVGGLLHEAAVELDRPACVAVLDAEGGGAAAHLERALRADGQEGAAREQVDRGGALSGALMELGEGGDGPLERLADGAGAASGEAAVVHGGGAVAQAHQQLAGARGVAEELDGAIAGLVELVEVAVAEAGEGDEGVDEGGAGGVTLELGERLEAGDVIRVLGERALEGADRRGRVAAVVAVPEAEAPVELGGELGRGGEDGGGGALGLGDDGLPGAVFGGGGLDQGDQLLVDAPHRGHVAGRVGDRGVPAAEGGAGADDAEGGGAVVRLRGDHGAVAVEGAAVVGEATLAQLGVGGAEGDEAGAVVGGQGGDRLAVGVGGELPALSRGDEAAQLGLDRGLRRVEGEGAAEELRGAVLVVEVALAESGALAQDRGLGERIVGDGEAGLGELGELGELAAAAVEIGEELDGAAAAARVAEQLREARAGAGVRGVDGEGAAVAGDGGVGLA
jgi:hypothetical protein